jgi:hypothetical protein
MSAEENKGVARRFMDEVYNKGNVDFIDEVVASNLVVHDPTSPEGMSSDVGVPSSSSRCTVTPSPTFR